MVLAASQKAISGQCFGAPSGPPAWKSKPSWYQISDNDNMIPPQTQREMAERTGAEKIINLSSGHLSALSMPKDVINLILEALGSF